MTALIKNSQRSLKADTRRIREITENLLTFLKLQDKDVSILLIDNRQIQKLNKKFFGRDKPTNVISFSYLTPVSDKDKKKSEGHDFPCETIGDIVVSIERAQEEALSLNVPLYERVFALIIHGLLHILGYDHENGGNESRRMRYREKKLLEYVTSLQLYKDTTP